jgi:GNAT superfamily N-acetyltransferase
VNLANPVNPVLVNFVSMDITMEQLREEDLAEADRIFRLAFGTFMGMPDPSQFHQGSAFINARWHEDPSATFAAKVDGKLAGTNLATNWGSVGFFGPLTVHPDYWDRGLGKLLMEPVMEQFERWGTRHAGLFTFGQSPKHLGLYQKFGFWPRYLTAIMSQPVKGWAESPAQLFSELSPAEQKSAQQACRELTNEIYEGLNVDVEINAVLKQKLGDTLLLWSGSKLSAMAVCHCGEETEAGPGTCYVKFGAVRPSEKADQEFDRLLSAAESFAAKSGLPKLVAGVNTARIEAYQQMLMRGFRSDFQGVAMHRPNEAGYSRPGVYVIDDWR